MNDGKLRGSAWLRAPLRWLLDSATVSMFRSDKWLLAAFLALSASALAPLFVTLILPLVDMGVNIGAAGLLKDAAFGHGVVAQHYFLNPRLVPYWTVYLLMGGLASVFGPFWSVKLSVGLAVILLPLSSMRLMRAFGRDPRLGLWVFALSWDRNLYWGWITFSLGMAMCLWALALVFEVRSLRSAFKLVPLSIVIALTHIHAVVLTLVAGGLLALIKKPVLRAIGLHVLALSGCGLLVAPWALSKIGLSSDAPRVPFSFVDHPLEGRIGNLYGYTLDVITNVEGAPPPMILKIAFGVLLFGALPFLLLKPRSTTPAQRSAPAVFFMAVAALYLFVPFQIAGPIEHYWTYPRFGTYLLIALLLLPRPRLDGWRALLLVPGLVSAVLLHRAVQAQFRSYGAYVAPYKQIVAALPRNKLMLPLDLDDFTWNQTHEGVLAQIHGYAAVAKSCFDPHLFDDPSNPLRYRASTMPPSVNWNNPKSFSFDSTGYAYDYIIVHSVRTDPFNTHPAWRAKVNLAKEAGPWRLYEVKH